MPLDRKRKASENESAISKLRQRRSASSKPSTRESTPPAAEDQVQHAATVVDRQVQKSKSTKRSANLPVTPTLLDQNNKVRIETKNLHLTAEDENSFAALNQLDVAQGQRVYERLPDGKLRVELSAGSDCVIAGRCTLWVKHGTVFLLGAVLEASPVLHQISAPMNLALPTIWALESDAEFELDGITEVSMTRALESPNIIKLSAVIKTSDTVSSYYVLGLDFSLPVDIGSAPPRLGLDDGYFTDAPELGKKDAPCIVLSGSRSLETATLARCMLNRLLTVRKAGTGAILLDLSSGMPVASTPGFLSLSTFNGPVFGPSSDRTCQTRVTVAKQHFVGPTELDIQSNSWYRSCVIDLLFKLSELRMDHPYMPIVMRLGHEIALDEELNDAIWKLLAPTSVHVVESMRVVSTTDRLRASAERNGTPLRLLRSINESTHASRMHSMSIESYFLSMQDDDGTTVARCGIESLQEVVLLYDVPGANLSAVSTIDVHIPQSNVHQVIVGLLAAVIVVDISVLSLYADDLLHCTTSRLPLLPSLTRSALQASKTECLGICYVKTVDVAEGKIVLRTPISRRRLGAVAADGKTLVLVIQPPTREGLFMPS